MNLTALAPRDPRATSLFTPRAPAPIDAPSQLPPPPPTTVTSAATAPPIDLPALCEPLFRYVCQLSRAGAGGAYDFAGVRREVVGRIQAARAAAADAGTLAGQYDLIEPVLVYFVDFTIATAPLPFAAEWGECRLAYELRPPCMTGDTEFFHQLDRTLADPGDAAVDRLAVFYLCLGLGFAGMYLGRPEAAPFLRRRMQECAARLRGRIDPAESPICPDAYVADPRDPHVPFARWACALAIATACMVVVLYVANLVSFRDRAAGLQDAATRVAESAAAGAATRPSTSLAKE